MKMRVSEIRMKRIRVNQGLSVIGQELFFAVYYSKLALGPKFWKIEDTR